MPIIFDPEFQVELEKSIDNNTRASKKLMHFPGLMVVAFVAVFVALRTYEADTTMIISAMIAIGSVGLAYTAAVLGRLIFTMLAIQTATAEWIGRKQLGEYEPPPGSGLRKEETE